jgi:hypothetical protein
MSLLQRKFYRIQGMTAGDIEQLDATVGTG